jgi:hypothetical protein
VIKIKSASSDGVGPPGSIAAIASDGVGPPGSIAAVAAGDRRPPPVMSRRHPGAPDRPKIAATSPQLLLKRAA